MGYLGWLWNELIVQQLGEYMKAKFIAVTLVLAASNLTAQVSVISPTTPVKSVEITQNKIDLNKAELSSLVGSFKGIGKKRAQAIINYRESHHGFKSIEELGDVKGLGQHFITAHRERLNETFVINTQ